METINEQKMVKARKQHRCSLCNKVINKGESYISAVYKHDDEIYIWRQHTHCQDLTFELKMFDDCEILTSEDFCENIEYAFYNLVQKYFIDMHIQYTFEQKIELLCKHFNIFYNE